MVTGVEGIQQNPAGVHTEEEEIITEGLVIEMMFTKEEVTKDPEGNPLETTNILHRRQYILKPYNIF